MMKYQLHKHKRMAGGAQENAGEKRENHKKQTSAIPETSTAVAQ
jgi:hypothetical protein